MRRIAIVVCCLACAAAGLAPGRANAQGVLLYLGHHDNQNPEEYWWDGMGVEYDVSYGGVYGGQFAFSSVLTGDDRGRWSMEFFYHSATVKPTNQGQIVFWNLEDWKYTLKTVAVNYQRRIGRSSAGHSFWLGLGVGITKWSDKPVEGIDEPCSELGCDPEPFRWVWMPGASVVFKLSDMFGLQCDLRYLGIVNGRDSIYPFSSGIQVQAGLLIEQPLGAKEEEE